MQGKTSAFGLQGTTHSGRTPPEGKRRKKNQLHARLLHETTIFEMIQCEVTTRFTHTTSSRDSLDSKIKAPAKKILLSSRWENFHRRGGLTDRSNLKDVMQFETCNAELVTKISRVMAFAAGQAGTSKPHQATTAPKGLLPAWCEAEDRRYYEYWFKAHRAVPSAAAAGTDRTGVHKLYISGCRSHITRFSRVILVLPSFTHHRTETRSQHIEIKSNNRENKRD